MNIATSTTDINREQWLEERKKGIGGSDAAAIAGLNKWKSPLGVYLEKIGEIQDDFQSEAAYWGSQLEDLIAKEFSIRTGLKVQRKNAILQHQEYPFMIANLDRIILDPSKGRGVLECKTTSAYNKDAWANGKVPDEYMLQVQHYLAVTGYEYAYIAVLIGGQAYHHIYIPRDQEIINYLIQIESDFWTMVENRTPPEMDGSDASSDILSILYPESKPNTEIELSNDALVLIDDYQKAAANEKVAKEFKEECANKLKIMLADNETGIVGNKKVSWKSVTSKRFDTTAFKNDHKSLYDQYTKEFISRRFTITEIKEAK